VKLEPYPKYKPSGVEWLEDVPEGWALVKLGAIALIETGPFGSQLHSEDYIEDGCPVINPAHIQNGKLFPDPKVSVDDETAARLSRHAMQAGDIVFGRRGEMGRCALVNECQTGWLCGTGSLRVALDQNRAHSKFVAAALRTPRVRDWLQLESVGSTMDNLNAAILSRVSLALPLINDQISIAAVLDRETAKIDTLIAKQEKLIELLQEKRRAVISHAVTKGLDPTVPMKPSGVEWLGDVPAHWNVTKLKYATCLVVDCPHETPVYDPDGEFVVVRTADVSAGVLDLENSRRLNEEEYIKRTRRSELNPDDIVYGREGERWGFAALVPSHPRMCLGQRMMQFRAAKHTCPSFLMWQLNADSVYSQGDVDVVGATSPHVNVETIRNFALAEPLVDEQKLIAEFIDRELAKIDTLIAKAQQAIELQKEHRTALISAAVTGKIDVRGLVDADLCEEKAA
jgi:type I restriction enzyme S subunit